MSGEPAVVDARGVSLSLSGRQVLHGVDLTVEPGEFLALMGANGSGKSTLVRALTGLRPLSAGTVSLFGTPLNRFRDWGRLGFVPQRASAASGVPASVREVVAAGRLGRRRPLAPLSRSDRRAIRDALQVVGIEDLARRSVATLSGGQQQRVLIARALAGEPDLFLLDEPTAGVDLPHQQALARSLSVLKERGKAVLLVAHELGPLQALVDRAVVLSHGEVTYDGAPLADDDVHVHHHAQPLRHDHTPHVGSPLDTLQEGAR
ncbi:metal ABC transporter ATP-binding protein [Nocardioides coralli]|uniref:metal ABC transporter ATP-binding protein n=1 Tax=Nocardioides coralli TaxID=2872154 RepID=UPI0020178ABD|nr:ABC transporter ATP-binding protein [Nocardioides coralli]